MEDLIEQIRNNPKIETIYGLRFDSSFKNLYKDKKQLQKMIRELFSEEILNIESFRNQEFVKDNVNLKCGICDLIAETKDYILLVEMQNNNLNDFKKRLKRYVSMLYVTQKLGDNYVEMKPVKVYLILNYGERKKQVLKIYREMEKNLKEEFDYLSEIRVWNIKEALKMKHGMDYNYARLYLLDQFTKEEALNILKELYQDERFKEIVEKIIIYNLDLKTYQKLKEEKYMLETSFALETSGLREKVKREALREGRKEGKKIGMKEGMKKGKIEIACQLFSSGVPLELLVKVTGLKEEQILNFQQ